MGKIGDTKDSIHMEFCIHFNRKYRELSEESCICYILTKYDYWKLEKQKENKDAKED